MSPEGNIHHCGNVCLSVNVSIWHSRDVTTFVLPVCVLEPSVCLRACQSVCDRPVSMCDCPVSMCVTTPPGSMFVTVLSVCVTVSMCVTTPPVSLYVTTPLLVLCDCPVRTCDCPVTLCDCPVSLFPRPVSLCAHQSVFPLSVYVPILPVYVWPPPVSMCVATPLSVCVWPRPCQSVYPTEHKSVLRKHDDVLSVTRKIYSDSLNGHLELTGLQ